MPEERHQHHHQPGECALWEEISKPITPADFEFAFSLRSELQLSPQARERGAGCKTHTNRFNIIRFILIGKLALAIFRSIFFPTEISVQICSNSVSVTSIVENSCYLARIQTSYTLHSPLSRVTSASQSVRQKTYRVLRLCPKETVEKIYSRRVKREEKKR